MKRSSLLILVLLVLFSSCKRSGDNTDIFPTDILITFSNSVVSGQSVEGQEKTIVYYHNIGRKQLFDAQERVIWINDLTIGFADLDVKVDEVKSILGSDGRGKSLQLSLSQVHEGFTWDRSFSLKDDEANKLGYQLFWQDGNGKVEVLLDPYYIDQRNYSAVQDKRYRLRYEENASYNGLSYDNFIELSLIDTSKSYGKQLFFYGQTGEVDHFYYGSLTDTITILDDVKLANRDMLFKGYVSSDNGFVQSYLCDSSRIDQIDEAHLDSFLVDSVFWKKFWEINDTTIAANSFDTLKADLRDTINVYMDEGGVPFVYDLNGNVVLRGESTNSSFDKNTMEEIIPFELEDLHDLDIQLVE